MVIYLTTNLINGKKYIGRDSKNDPKYFGSGHALLRAMKKYGKHNFKKEIIEECASFDELERREEYWLNYYDAGGSEEFYNMHNHSSGGALGMNITQETRKKLRDLNLGKKLSEETKRKMSESTKGKKNHFFGKTHSEESRKKIKEARRNQVIHISDETKRKIRDSQKGKPKPFRFEKICDSCELSFISKSYTTKYCEKCKKPKFSFEKICYLCKSTFVAKCHNGKFCQECKENKKSILNNLYRKRRY